MNDYEMNKENEVKSQVSIKPKEEIEEEIVKGSIRVCLKSLVSENNGNQSLFKNIMFWLSLVIAIPSAYFLTIGNYNIGGLLFYGSAYLLGLVSICLVSYEDIRYMDYIISRKGRKEYWIGFSWFLIFTYEVLSGNMISIPVMIFILGFCPLIIATCIDFEYHELPDTSTWLFLGTTVIALLCAGGFANIMNRIIFALPFMLLYAAISKFSLGLGWGDVKLLLPISLLLTNITMVLNFWLYVLIPAIMYALCYVLRHKEEYKEKKMKLQFAFGPFLVLGLMIAQMV